MKRKILDTRNINRLIDWVYKDLKVLYQTIRETISIQHSFFSNTFKYNYKRNRAFETKSLGIPISKETVYK